MRISVCICDLCSGDEARVRFAIARYWNNEGRELHACRRHLADVKRAGLDYEMFTELGDPE